MASIPVSAVDNAAVASPAVRPAGRLTRLQLIAVGFPALPHSFIALPFNIVIPAFYATHTSVTLLQIGVVTSVSRIADAVIDPMVGFVSDRIRTPLGNRIPLILLASLVCSLGLFFLFQPPPTATIAYYGLWSFVLYFGFSLFEIPRSAWSAEINRDYAERSRINTSIAQFNVVGSLIFWLVPILLAAGTGTTALTGSSLTVIVGLYILLMPASVVVSAVLVRGGRPVVSRPLRLMDIAKSLATNRPLILYYLAIGTWGLGQGASLSTILLFIDDRLGLGSAFPFIMIAYFGVTVLSIPLWMRLVPRLGRHRLWAVSLIGSALARPLILMVSPGPQALWPMLGLTCLNAALGAPWNFAPTSILSDVIDYDFWRSGANKAGNLFAFNTLLIKVTMALGAGGAFVLLSAFHYHAGKTNNAGGALTGLLLAYLLVPGVLHVLAGALAWVFPLDARRHAIVQRRLEGRSRAAPAGA
jgi:Na+/melibiose symporter-like transporter